MDVQKLYVIKIEALKEYQVYLKSVYVKQLSGSVALFLEHSEDKIITQSGLFESEVGPGLIEFSFQETLTLQECQKHKAQVTEGVLILSYLLGIPTRCMFVKRCTKALQAQPRFQNT